ncbi:MAG: YdcF family protein [Bacteroidales bacterium]|nr:YdcF family protein [Bacteroidales bacterium]
MFFIISKILEIFMSPVLLVIGLLIFSLIYFKKNSKRSKKLLIAALLLFYFFSNSFIIDELMRVWEIQVTRTENLADNYKVGIVMGGGTITYDYINDRRTYRNNIDRVLQAIELYKTGKIDKILLSGGAGNLIFRDMLEAELLKDFLLQIGINEKDILIDTLSDNTYQNAVYCARILKKNHLEKENILLITSAVHMRRSLGCFKKQDINVIPYSTNKYAGIRRYQFEHLFIPQLVNFILWKKLIHETIGYVVYDIYGYI